MAQNKTLKSLTVLAAGVTTSFSVNDAVDLYEIVADAGAVTLAGNVTITSSGTPNLNTTYSIVVKGGFTLGANTFTIPWSQAVLMKFFIFINNSGEVITPPMIEILLN